MALWSSRTKAWNNKTRPVTNGHGDKKIEITKKEIDEIDEDIEIEDLQKDIAVKDWEIKLLKARVEELESQMMGYIKRVDNQATFMQETILRLIEIKNAPAPVMLPARSALEQRLLEKKNSELSVSEAQKAAKLP